MADGDKCEFHAHPLPCKACAAEAVVADTEVEAEGGPDDVILTKLKKSELLALALNAGFEGCADMTKAELITALADQEPAAEITEAPSQETPGTVSDDGITETPPTQSR